MHAALACTISIGKVKSIYLPLILQSALIQTDRAMREQHHTLNNAEAVIRFVLWAPTTNKPKYATDLISYRKKFTNMAINPLSPWKSLLS